MLRIYRGISFFVSVSKHARYFALISGTFLLRFRQKSTRLKMVFLVCIFSEFVCGSKLYSVLRDFLSFQNEIRYKNLNRE